MRSPQKLLQEVRRALLAATALGAFSTAGLLALPFLALHVVDGLVGGGATADTLPLVALIVAGALGMQVCVDAARRRILLRASLWLDHALGQYLLETGLRSAAPSESMHQVARALTKLRGGLAGGVLMRALDAPWAPILLLAILVLQPVLAGLAAVFAVLLALAALATKSRLAALGREQIRAGRRAEAWWYAVAASGPARGALGLAESAALHWERLNRAHVAGAYALGRRAARIEALAGSLQAVSATILLVAGAWLVTRHALTPGALVACLLLNASLLASLTQVVAALPALHEMRAAYRELDSLPTGARSAPATEGRPAGGVVLEGVTCRREGRSEPVLASVSLALPPGRTLGIMGARGAGKSTLAAVLAGTLAPAEGSATLDGIPIGDWLQGDTVRIGYLPDTPALLEGSVHQNIARFRDTSLLAVSLAAMRAGVHDTLVELPQGYRTQVGPGGSALTLRERRAVALARAVFGAPQLIVLDEPELGLDGAGLRRLIRILEDLKQDGAGLLIATDNERLLELADMIVTLDAGSVQSFAPRSDRPVLSGLGQYTEPPIGSAQGHAP